MTSTWRIWKRKAKYHSPNTSKTVTLRWTHILMPLTKGLNFPWTKNIFVHLTKKLITQLRVRLKYCIQVPSLTIRGRFKSNQQAILRWANELCIYSLKTIIENGYKRGNNCNRRHSVAYEMARSQIQNFVWGDWVHSITYTVWDLFHWRALHKNVPIEPNMIPIHLQLILHLLYTQSSSYTYKHVSLDAAGEET